MNKQTVTQFDTTWLSPCILYIYSLDIWAIASLLSPEISTIFLFAVGNSFAISGAINLILSKLSVNRYLSYRIKLLFVGDAKFFMVNKLELSNFEFDIATRILLRRWSEYKNEENRMPQVNGFDDYHYWL